MNPKLDPLPLVTPTGERVEFDTYADNPYKEAE